MTEYAPPDGYTSQWANTRSVPTFKPGDRVVFWTPENFRGTEGWRDLHLQPATVVAFDSSLVVRWDRQIPGRPVRDTEAGMAAQYFWYEPPIDVTNPQSIEQFLEAE